MVRYLVLITAVSCCQLPPFGRERGRGSNYQRKWGLSLCPESPWKGLSCYIGECSHYCTVAKQKRNQEKKHSKLSLVFSDFLLVLPTSQPSSRGSQMARRPSWYVSAVHGGQHLGTQCTFELHDFGQNSAVVSHFIQSNRQKYDQNMGILHKYITIKIWKL